MGFISPFEDAGGAWDALTIVVSASGRTEKWTWLETNVDVEGQITNDWDIQKSQGADGARTKDNGYQPTKISLSWLLWKPEHWTAHESFMQSAKPRPGKDPKPIIMVVHPQLQALSLVMFRLATLHVPVFKAVDQWEAKLELIEYFADPKPVVAPEAPSAGPDPNPPPRGSQYIKQSLEVISRPGRPEKPSTKVKPT